MDIFSGRQLLTKQKRNSLTEKFILTVGWWRAKDWTFTPVFPQILAEKERRYTQKNTGKRHHTNTITTSVFPQIPAENDSRFPQRKYGKTTLCNHYQNVHFTQRSAKICAIFPCRSAGNSNHANTITTSTSPKAPRKSAPSICANLRETQIQIV